MSEIDEIFDTILGKSYDPYSGPREEDFDMWTTSYGKTLRMSEMTNSHLVNAINFWKNIYEGEVYKKIGDVLHTKTSDKLAAKFVNAMAHVRAMVMNEKYKYLWEEALKRGLVKK